MKKVMMFIAVAVCAVAVQVQGAAIIWGNDGNPVIAGPTGGALSLTAATAASLIVNLVDITQGDTVIASASIASMTAGTLTGATSNYTLGTDAFVDDTFKVVMYGTFTVEGVTGDYVRTFSDPSWILVASIGNGSTDTFAWGGNGFRDTGWVLIPEPTAMALLALGAAAVGLRRRFRK